MRENIDTTTGSPMPDQTTPTGEPVADEQRGRFARQAPVAAEPPPRRFARREPVEEGGAPGAGRPLGGAPAARRRGGWRKRRSPTAAAVGTLGAGMVAIARLVMTLAMLIALLIVLAIVLRDVEANASNAIVKGIHEGANFFAGGFTDLIRFSGHPKRAISVNWGIAAFVYLFAGALIAGMIARVGRSGSRFRAARTAPVR
jgi:hypothetical protein